MADQNKVAWTGEADLGEYFTGRHKDTPFVPVFGWQIGEGQRIRIVQRNGSPCSLIVERCEHDAMGSDSWVEVEMLHCNDSPGSVCYERFLNDDGDDEGAGEGVGVNPINPMNGEWVACVVVALLDGFQSIASLREELEQQRTRAEAVETELRELRKQMGGNP